MLIDTTRFFYSELLLLLQPQGVIVSSQVYEDLIRPYELKLLRYRTPLTGIEQSLSKISILQTLKYLRDGKVIVSDQLGHRILAVFLSFLGFEKRRYRNKFYGVF